MDISSIASMITTVLQQYLTSRSQGTTQGTGQQSGIAQQLFSLVRDKLSGQPESAQTLQHFEQAPQQNAGAMQNALTQHLSSDPSFLAQAASHLQQINPGAQGIGGMISDLLGGKKDEPGKKAA